ncbi:MAG: hypothetical protein DRG82_12310 [Deltaproteobacteria bacterium]|nr:MAG: hypothetical protein DRG82_12310 [Deltaproteobacteria bacterium]
MWLAGASVEYGGWGQRWPAFLVDLTPPLHREIQRYFFSLSIFQEGFLHQSHMPFVSDCISMNVGRGMNLFAKGVCERNHLNFLEP